FRRCLISAENGARLLAIERRGYRGNVFERADDSRAAAILKAHEIWKTRRRVFDKDEDGYSHLQSTLDRVLALVGRDLACHVVFAEERAYWQKRNRAGQTQKMRQDRLGL